MSNRVSVTTAQELSRAPAILSHRADREIVPIVPRKQSLRVRESQESADATRYSEHALYRDAFANSFLLPTSFVSMSALDGCAALIAIIKICFVARKPTEIVLRASDQVSFPLGVFIAFIA